MFERFLEKVLLNVLGPYIEGIDRNNFKLGLWKGSVSISQVALKPEILELLDLPLKMNYSSIGNLSISIPWKSLGSKPIEVLIEDIHLILQPIDKDSWKSIDFRTVNQKLRMMNTFIQNYTAKMAQKEKEKNKTGDNLPEDQSLVARLTEKAIDNIQITIRNIHFRFEDPLPKRQFAWGITLDEILLHTTNDNWEFEFIDRTLPENKLLPMKKKLLLKNLGVYWDSHVELLYGSLLPAMAKQQMKDHILRDSQDKNKSKYIINISAECRLIQKNKKDPETKDNPEFDLSLQIIPIDLIIQKTQVEDMLQLVEYLNDYQKFRFRAMRKRQQQVEELMTETEAESQRQLQLEEFAMLFEKIRLKDPEEGFKNLRTVEAALDGPEQSQLFEELLMTLPDQDIGIAMKQKLKEIEKSKKMRELTQKKEEKDAKKGKKRKFIKDLLFKNLSFHKTDDEEEKEEEETPKEVDSESTAHSSFWESEDMHKIEKYIEESFPDESDIESETSRNLLKFRFILEGGMICLVNTTEEGHEEGISFQYTGLIADGHITSQTKKVDVALEDLSFNLRTRYAGSSDYIETHVIRRVNYWLAPEKSGNLLSLTFEDCPMGRKEGTYISLKAQQLEIVYRKALLDRLLDYSSLAKNNEALKSQALDQADKKEGMKELKPKEDATKKEPEPFKRQYISVDIAAPVIVVPLLQNGDLKSECWVLNLGHFIAGSQDPMSTETLIYDLFDLALGDIKFQYYPSHSLYNRTQKSLVEKNDLSLLTNTETEEYKKAFNLIEKFDIRVKLEQMLPHMENAPEGKGQPKMNVEVTIPIVHLQLRKDVYQGLLKIPDLLDVQIKSDVEIVENEKEKILANPDHVGYLYLREKVKRKSVWTKCQTVLKGRYLYLFKHQDDQKPTSTYFIKNAVLTECEDTEKKFAFSLENRYNKAYFAGENQEEMRTWLEELVYAIDESSTASLNTFVRTKSLRKQKSKITEEELLELEKEEKVDYELTEMKVWVKIEELKLNTLHPDDSTMELISLDTNNLRLDLTKKPKKTIVDIKLETLEIKDSSFNFTNPDLQSLVTSQLPAGSKLKDADLIEIHMVSMEKDHPNYHEKMTDTNVQVNFGYLYVNLKPEVICGVMKFFLSAPVSQDMDASIVNKPPEKKKTTDFNQTYKKQQETTFTDRTPTTLLGLEINLKEVGVRLIHMKNHMCIGELALKKTNLKVRQKLHLLEFEGVLGNIQLFETTNYPNTIDSNLHYDRIKKFELIGVAEENENLLELSFLQYEPQHPEAKNATNTYMFVDVSVGRIKVNYIQKPVLRLLDFVSTQLVPSLSPPEESIIPSSNKEDEDPEVVHQMNQENAERNLKNPKFMDLKVNVKSPIIVVKPLPNSKTYWEIQLGDVYVENKVHKDTTRFRNTKKPLEFIYCEMYNIQLQSMGISRIEGDKKVQLTREVNFDLSFDMPKFIPEYKLLYGDKSQELQEFKDESKDFYLDERMVLKGKMTPLITTLEHEDLLLLMRILNSNITYDDGKDELFEMDGDFAAASRKQQKKDKKDDDKETKAKKEPIPITVNLTFENFTLLALEKTRLPFAMINLHLLKIDIFQDAKGALYGGIRACELNGSFFEETPNSLTEKKMFGNLDHPKEHSLVGKTTDKVREDITDSLIKYTENLVETFSTKSESQKNLQLSINLDFQATGEKTVRIDINGLKAFLVPDIYLHLLQFIDMNDYNQEIRKSQSVKEMHESKTFEPEPPKNKSSAPVKEGFIRVEVDIRNILITVPASKFSATSSPHVLALRGDILCSFDGRPEPSLKHELQFIEATKCQKAIEQCADHNQVMQVKATLSKFELFICEFEDLITTKNFKDVRKRNLILPFSLSAHHQGYMVPNKSRTELIAVANNQVVMELVVLRMSYQDALLLNNTVQYQLEQLGDIQKKEKPDSEKKERSKTRSSTVLPIEESKEDEAEIRRKETRRNTEIIDVQRDMDENDWKANYQEFSIQSQGVQIVLINDAEGTLVPAMEATLQGLEAVVVMVDKNVIVSTKILVSCSYFNSLPSKWEPIIEKFCLELDVVMKDDPKLSVMVSLGESSEVLNIDISEEMLITLYSTLMTWKSDYERKVVKQDKNNKLSKVSLADSSGKEEIQMEDELIDYVSPYMIENQTGYPIQVEADHAAAASASTNTIDHTRDNYGYSRSRTSKLQELYNRVYQIEPNGEAQYLLESNIEDLFKQTTEEAMTGLNYIKVKINHPDCDIEPITGINIDKAITSGYRMKAHARDGTVFSHDNFQLFADIRLEKNRKVIILSSPIRITNKTRIPYSILMEGKNLTKETLLQPGETAPVPIDFIDGTFCLKANGTSVPSLKRALNDFITTELAMIEVQAGPSYVLMESVKKDPNTKFYEISLRPPFSIKNCCGLDIHYRITTDLEDDTDVIKLNPQATSFETKMSTRSDIFMQIRVPGFYWSPKVPIHSLKTKSKNEREIVINDALGNPLSVYLFSPEEEAGTRKFFLYTKACIINETPYDLKYLIPEENKKVQVPGQIPTDADEGFNPKILLVNETKRLEIKRKGQDQHSGIINVASVGSSYVELLQDEGNSMLELGLDMSIQQCDREYKLMTKIISISPRYIMVNKTKYEAEVKREGGEKESFVLPKDTREAFQWSDWGSFVKEKSIAIRLQDPENKELWDWSKGVDVSQVGEYNFVMRSQDRDQVKYMRTTVTLDKSIMFIVIEEEEAERIAFKLRNDCPGLIIRAYQDGSSPVHGTLIKSGEVVPWSWEFPNKRKDILIDFCANDDDRFFTTGQKFKIGEVHQAQRVVKPEHLKDQLEGAFSVVTMEGGSRVLSLVAPSRGEITEKSQARKILEQEAPEEKTKPIFNMNLEVNLTGLGVSVIGNLKNRQTKRKERKEIAYLFLRGLQFKMLDSDENTITQLRVKRLDLDNNTSYDLSFPVNITPTKPHELTPESRNYFLDVLISQKKNTDIQHFETIQFLLAETTFRGDGMFLDAIIEMVNNVTTIFNDQEYFTTKHNIPQSLYANTEEAQRLHDIEHFNSKFDWKNRGIAQVKSNIFIQHMIVNPIFLNLTFQLKKTSMTENIFFVANLFANSVGSAVLNLDNAPVHVKGFKLDNVFDSEEGIKKKILDKLKDDAGKSIVKIVGSMDVIGNPVGLIKNISTGFTDLVEKPIDGFLQGPLEGGKGVLKGAGSLVKNTVSGTFNSIGKITGSLASGFSHITMDEEYLAHREKARLKRPNHLGEGLYQGLSAIVKGVGYGVKGVFTQPMEGASTDGAKGFFKGTVKGVTGLVAKPVAGILDAASKTAEGVKNTANMFDQRPSNNRVRFPRAFYGKEKYYRTEMPTDGEIIWLLHHTKNTKYRDMSLICAFDVFPDVEDKDNSCILALSYEYVLAWDVKHAKLMWAFNPKDIKKVNLYQDGMQIELDRSAEISENDKPALINCDPVQNEFIGKKLIQLKRLVE